MVCIEALSTRLGAGTSDRPLPGTRGIPANTGQAAVARQAARNTATAGCFMTFSWCGYGFAGAEVTPDITLSCHITGAGIPSDHGGPYHGRLASLWICGASMALDAPKS